ncbi:hypothetical protein MLD38_006043 [Melastoma candidum]|uniref:Uncharacterized protein n=1 Tax=Melastoma candidum TaxID=119954 RepID=A0ACB9RV31_9MYRT|nr:hypothetical protein MLD38_006043 [Melastoma candidum]
MSHLKQIHSLVVTSGLSLDDPFCSRILAYASLSELGDVDYLYRVLQRLSDSTTWCWNAVIRGYSNGRNPKRCFDAFVDMLRLGLSPDHMTYPFLAKAAAKLQDLKQGMSVHASAMRCGLEVDRFVINSLIHFYASSGDIVSARKAFDGITLKNLVSWNSILDGYAKCGDMGSARKLFDLMRQRDVVSWSALIDGYVKSGEYNEALVLFDRMRVVGPKANEVTMVSVLCACAHLGALDQGKAMHQYLVENHLRMTLVLQTSLLDMYTKCGAIDEAWIVFRGVSTHKTDVLLWNAMIGGLASHGMAEDALRLYFEMKRNRISPDEITYLCLLSACAHGGLIGDAWHFFNCLSQHGMAPKSEHFACMVDALARAGRLEEAYHFLQRMPLEQSGSMLGALLNGCIKHRRLDLAEIIGKKLIELEPENDGRYVGLSNVYAGYKRWADVRMTREEMENRGVKKEPAFSFIETFGFVHRFIARDKTHPCTEQIYRMLDLITEQCRPNTGRDDQSLRLNEVQCL